MTLAATVQQCLVAFLPQLERAGRVYVGYSGGLDSHVLLRGLVDLLGADAVTALHVNHQLSPNAGLWADHCRRVCEGLGVDYLGEDVVVPTAGSRENAAREARYQVFEKHLGRGDILTLAHHVDDQAETVLYRLLRRSGPRGLAGIPVSRPLGLGSLLRPLLTLDRDLLYRFARENSFQWIEDESNLSRDFDRNFLRHDVVPLLRSRWPDYAKRIAAAATLCEQAEELNEGLARLDLDALALRAERGGWSIDIASLNAFSDIRQANVLRYLTRQKGFKPPGHRIIGEVINTVLQAGSDRNPVVSWPGGQWRRFRQRLFLLSPHVASSEAVSETDTACRDGGQTSELQSGVAIPWPVTGNLALTNTMTLSATEVLGSGIAAKFFDHLSVSFRQGGERCQPAGRAGSAGLKKLFQEYSLPPWLRQQVPLIYRNGELVAVGDLWVCEGFQAGVGERGFRMRWDFSGAGEQDDT